LTTVFSLNKELRQQSLQELSKIDNIDEELLVTDNDFLMSCFDRICVECGNDHSFRPNYEGVNTSIDIILKLQKKRNNNSKSQNSGVH
jgi:hypothetical protein